MIAAGRRGHFRLASGHHGDRWLDLDGMLAAPAALAPYLAALADRMRPHSPDVVCGPLTGGAFVAFDVAARLGAGFAYSEQPGYAVPAALRTGLAGRRVAVVDDAVNAGSAVVATAAAVRACGADVVAFGALVLLGTSAGVPVEAVERVPNRIWAPAECPQCAEGADLEDPTA